MRDLTKSTRYTSKLTQWHPPEVTTPILCYKQVLCQSLFRKALPRRPVASVDIHTMNALPMALHAVSVTRRITWLSNVEALGGGTAHQNVHPPWEDHRNRSKEDPLATSSSTKAETRRRRRRWWPVLQEVHSHETRC